MQIRVKFSIIRSESYSYGEQIKMLSFINKIFQSFLFYKSKSLYKDNEDKNSIDDKTKLPKYMYL